MPSKCPCEPHYTLTTDLLFLLKTASVYTSCLLISTCQSLIVKEVTLNEIGRWQMQHYTNISRFSPVAFGITESAALAIFLVHLEPLPIPHSATRKQGMPTARI